MGLTFLVHLAPLSFDCNMYFIYNKIVIDRYWLNDSRYFVFQIADQFFCIIWSAVDSL